MTNRRRIQGLALLALLAGLATPAAATTVHRFSLDELIYVADRIVVGTVLSTDAAFTGDGGLIVTTVEVAVDEALEGPVPDGPLAVEVLGGEAAGYVLHVEGTPRFDVGERVLLFLEDGPHGLDVLGWAQGKLTVAWSPLAKTTMAFRDVLDPARANDDPLYLDGTPLDDLRSYITARVTAAHVPPYREIPGLPPHKRQAFRAAAGLPADGEVTP